MGAEIAAAHGGGGYFGGGHFGGHNFAHHDFGRHDLDDHGFAHHDHFFRHHDFFRYHHGFSTSPEATTFPITIGPITTTMHTTTDLRTMITATIRPLTAVGHFQTQSGGPLPKSCKADNRAREGEGGVWNSGATRQATKSVRPPAEPRRSISNTRDRRSGDPPVAARQ